MTFLLELNVTSMHSNFRNVVERHSNSSAHSSPSRARHGSVEQNSMEEDGNEYLMSRLGDSLCLVEGRKNLKKIK